MRCRRGCTCAWWSTTRWGARWRGSSMVRWAQASTRCGGKEPSALQQLPIDPRTKRVALLDQHVCVRIGMADQLLRLQVARHLELPETEVIQADRGPRGARGQEVEDDDADDDADDVRRWSMSRRCAYFLHGPSHAIGEPWGRLYSGDYFGFRDLSVEPENRRRIGVSPGAMPRVARVAHGIDPAIRRALTALLHPVPRLRARRRCCSMTSRDPRWTRRRSRSPGVVSTARRSLRRSPADSHDSPRCNRHVCPYAHADCHTASDSYTYSIAALGLVFG